MGAVTGRLGLASGVGLVAANMIGAGVFLSTGFMAQSMGPGPILVAWVVGAAMALCGATAYGAAARLVPRSGGEYRYLSDLLHPALGSMAGWASLLAGFSAPIAVDALAAGAFASVLVPGLPARVTAAACVLLLTSIHAVGWSASIRLQNLLVGVKVALLVAFVMAGLLLGSWQWPADWTAGQAGAGVPWGAFANSLFYIAFAFSGWNAVVYASEEFEDPQRTVPRAMQVGTLVVAAVYLAVNWVFVANLSPSDASVVFGYDRFTHGEASVGQVTLGHAIVGRLLGPDAATLWSGVMVLLFLSAMSAMVYVGPRVYAEMARDGVLPAGLAGREGEPPRRAVLLQGALALLIVGAEQLQGALAVIGAVLMLFAALTAAGVLKAGLRRHGLVPTRTECAASALYVLISGLVFAKGIANFVETGTTGDHLAGIATIAALVLVGWRSSRA